MHMEQKVIIFIQNNMNSVRYSLNSEGLVSKIRKKESLGQRRGGRGQQVEGGQYFSWFSNKTIFELLRVNWHQQILLYRFQNSVIMYLSYFFHFSLSHSDWSFFSAGIYSIDSEIYDDMSTVYILSHNIF